MFCMNCGKELPSGAKFCDVCGTKVGETLVSSNVNLQEFDVDDKYLKKSDLINYIKGCKQLSEYEKNIDIEVIDTLKIVSSKYNYKREYIVLSKDDEKVLLLLKKCEAKDNLRYGDSNEWEKSSIRSMVDMWVDLISDVNPNLLIKVETEKNVFDKKFLLSQDEVDKYLGDYKNVLNIGCDYWLRSNVNGNRHKWADMVEFHKQYNANDVSVVAGLRPAMWVKI